MSELDLIFSRKKKTEEEKKEEPKSETVEIPKEVEQKAEDKNIKAEDQTAGKNTTAIEEIMRKFIDKDPKIGIWSYPSYLLLQYLYNTIPGFKMSKVAREALEKGLKEMYPDLFEVAEKVAKEAKKI